MKTTCIAVACTALLASQVIQAAPIIYIRPLRPLPQGIHITPNHILTVEPSTKLWTATPRRPLYDIAVQRQLLEGRTVEVQSTPVEPDWLVKNRAQLKAMCQLEPSSALCAP